jgi:hypothetical protein
MKWPHWFVEYLTHVSKSQSSFKTFTRNRHKTFGSPSIWKTIFKWNGINLNNSTMPKGDLHGVLFIKIGLSMLKVRLAYMRHETITVPNEISISNLHELCLLKKKKITKVLMIRTRSQMISFKFPNFCRI